MVTAQSLAQQEQKKHIKSALDGVKQIFEQDTQKTISQIESIRIKNTATTIQFLKKEEEFKPISEKMDQLKSLCELGVLVLPEEINTLTQYI